MVFYSTFFPCTVWDYEGIARNRPDKARPPRPGLPTALFPAPPQTRATAAPETQKGGKISPAARRFPPSPLRKAVKPPLLVPVFRDRLLGELCDGQPIRFGPGEDRLDDVRRETVQGKDAADVAGFQAELL